MPSVRVGECKIKFVVVFICQKSKNYFDDISLVLNKKRLCVLFLDSVGTTEFSYAVTSLELLHQIILYQAQKLFVGVSLGDCALIIETNKRKKENWIIIGTLLYGVVLALNWGSKAKGS